MFSVDDEDKNLRFEKEREKKLLENIFCDFHK